MRNLFCGSKGQALVEMAFVLPLLIMLLLGTVEFGRIMTSYIVVTHASREGARAGAVGASDDLISSTAREAAGTLNEEDISVDIWPSSPRERGEPVNVKVYYEVPLVTPFIGEIITNPFPVAVTTSMRVE